MTVDALLAIVHHLAAFSLAALLVAELVLVRPGIGAGEIGRFTRVDRLYGIAAATVLVVGIGRLVFGAVPAEFYLVNVFFWTKMASFGAVALVSVLPTMRGIAWARASAAEATFVVPADEVRTVRRALHVELALLPLIPVSAALMARGIGTL